METKETVIDGVTYITVIDGGNAKSFLADESNPEYAAFLESLNDDTETE